MTYAEKVAELEKLKAEMAGRPSLFAVWDFPNRFPKLQEVEKPELPCIPKGECIGRRGLPEEFVLAIYHAYREGKSLAQLAPMLGRTRQSLYEIFRRRGLKLREDSKAKARIEHRHNGTSFSPGKDGYLRSTSGDRRPLHHLIWEELNGPIPAGFQVAFRDGNKRNFDLANLELVSAFDMLERGRRKGRKQ